MYEDISPQCIGITDGHSKPIRRAVNAATAMIQDVRIDHCRAHIAVVEEFLNRANVVASSRRCIANECRNVCGVAGFDSRLVTGLFQRRGK